MLPVAVRCRLVRRRLDGVVLGDERLAPQSERHFRECLKCQAEAASYRRMERGFAAMRHQVIAAPVNLLSRVMAGLDRSSARPARGRLAVPLSTASVLAVAAAVALILRRRHAPA